jgi:hypothetical protein
MTMEFELATSLPVLERGPSVFASLLTGLPDEWIRGDEGPDTWSPYVVIGHLIHGELHDWIPRARIILEHGESKPFEPFDRFAQLLKVPRPLEELLEQFANLRQEGLATLRGWNLSTEQLSWAGTHPELGPVTLSQLLATWVAHDLGHIAQVARVMAKQHAEAVGPWRADMPVMAPRG